MGSGCWIYSMWEESVPVLCLLDMLFYRPRTWLLYFLVWQIHSKGAVGRKHLWKGHMTDKVPEERNVKLWASTRNQWSSVRNMFLAPNPQFTLHCTLNDFDFFQFISFFSGLKADLWKWNKSSRPTLQPKQRGELSELKRNKQHRANLRTQISINVVETTPMTSPSSFLPEWHLHQGPRGLKPQSSVGGGF